MSGDFSLTWFTSIGFRSLFATSGPLFWQPELTDKPPMWQSGLAGVVLSMQSPYTVRIVFASPLPMSRSGTRSCHALKTIRPTKAKR